MASIGLQNVTIRYATMFDNRLIVSVLLMLLKKKLLLCCWYFESVGVVIFLVFNELFSCGTFVPGLHYDCWLGCSFCVTWFNMCKEKMCK